MKINLPTDTSNFDVKDPNFVVILSQALGAIVTALNGELTLSDNISCRFVTCIFPTANIQQAFLHNLNRIPKGYFVIGMNAAAIVYNGLFTSTPQYIYLRSSVATTINLIVF